MIKKILKIIGALILLGIIFAGGFATRCGRVQQNFKPVQDTIPQEVKDAEKGIEGYNRNEESTYLTLPEWYLVFNPQEYGDFLAHKKPSRFPYFASIGQFWSGYCQEYGITKHNYKFNIGDHVVESVIGTSFTIEYFAKGIYENTIGRISELFGGNVQTPEEVYAANVAIAYGKFIPTDPWYAFDFGHAFTGLWKDTSFFGPHFIRKIERKFALSLEYGVKFLYAKLIGLGTHATFGVAATKIYAHVGNNPSIFTNSNVTKISQFPDGTYIVTVPHYQGFTDTVPQLAEEGLIFLDLAGNDEIQMTVVAPKEWKYDLKHGSPFFEMPILTDNSLKRVVIQAPVKSLSEMLVQLKSENIRIEHLFDY